MMQVLVLVLTGLLSSTMGFGFLPTDGRRNPNPYLNPKPNPNPNPTRLHMALKPVVGGSVVALVTPMKSTTTTTTTTTTTKLDNQIDYPKLVDILKWHMEQGTDGAVILGTTGEASTISLLERAEVIKTAVSTVNKKFPIIIGTGTIETSKVIALSQQALDLGADACLVITPYYVKPPPRALVKHFTDIADAVALPMILYNCPGRTGVDMKPETIGEISKHPMIIGVKDATGILGRVAELRAACGPDFLLYSGEDDQGCEFVKLGGDGVISVTANVAPAAMHKMLKLSKEGKSEEAEAINQMLLPLHQRLFLEANPIPVKKALQMMGKIDSGIRPPLTSLAPEFVATLQEALMLGKAI